METNQQLINELLKEKKRLSVLLSSIDNLLKSYGHETNSIHSVQPVKSYPQSQTTLNIVQEDGSIADRFKNANNNLQKVLVALERIGKGDVSKISESWFALDSSISVEEIKKKVYPAIFTLKELQNKIEVVQGETGGNNSAFYRLKK